MGAWALKCVINDNGDGGNENGGMTCATSDNYGGAAMGLGCKRAGLCVDRVRQQVHTLLDNPHNACNFARQIQNRTCNLENERNKKTTKSTEDKEKNKRKRLKHAERSFCFFFCELITYYTYKNHYKSRLCVCVCRDNSPPPPVPPPSLSALPPLSPLSD